MNKLAVLLALVLALSASGPLFCADKDPVAADMKSVLKLGFEDTAQALAKEPARGCDTVKQLRTVFLPLMKEYATRSGDQRFNLRLKQWALKYCGHDLTDKDLGDGD